MIHISRGADLTLPAPARMPLVDSFAPAAVTGLPKRAAREALRRLCEHGYVGTVGNAITDNSRRAIHVRASAHRLCGLPEEARVSGLHRSRMGRSL